MKHTVCLKINSDKSEDKISMQIDNIRQYIEYRYKLSICDMAISWDDAFKRNMVLEITFEGYPKLSITGK